jgi:hypothetical protein
MSHDKEADQMASTHMAEPHHRAAFKTAPLSGVRGPVHSVKPWRRGLGKPLGRRGDGGEGKGYLRYLLELVSLIHPSSCAFSFAIVQALPMNSAWLNGERRSTSIGHSLQ